MNIDQKIITRFDELIAEGEAVLRTRVYPPRNSLGFDSRVDREMVYAWFTSAQNLVAIVFGRGSDHYKNLVAAPGTRGLTYDPAVKAQGILKASRSDYSQGYVFSLKRLVEAELFSDFLDQASHLLDKGYYQPAAVLAGSVLEDALRKMLVALGVEALPASGINQMNSELYKSEVYNRLTHKRITALADIRNSAAHGKIEEFSTEDVREMITWIERFMEEKYE